MLTTIFAVIFILIGLNGAWNANAARSTLLSTLHPHLPPMLLSVAFSSLTERLATCAITVILSVGAMIWYWVSDDMPFMMLLASIINIIATYLHLRLLAVVRLLAYQKGYVPN